jgi:ketosteroid isomerase-like protein
MIDRQWAMAFAQKWIDAFNSHDLETIFSLYEDDFEMTSPYIVERMGIVSGVLKGKESVRPYWQKSLSADPPLKFELIDVFVGVNSVVVYYKNIGRKMVCETFTFSENGKVISGCSQHGKSLSA